MWERALLRKEYTLPLLRAATQAGHVKFIEPESRSEKRQLDNLWRQMDDRTHESAAFRYSLLAESIFLDGSGFGWTIFEDLNVEPEDASELKWRHLIEYESPEFKEFIQLKDSGENFLSSGLFTKTAQEQANLYASLEPMIWASFRRGGENFSRGTLQALLDMLVLEPQLARGQFGEIGDYERAAKEILKKRFAARKLSPEILDHLSWILYRAMTKGSVAVNEIFESEKLDAFFPIPNFELGESRLKSGSVQLSSVKNDDIISSIGMFLKEIEQWPEINGFDDLLKIRKNRHFSEFRGFLSRWIDAIEAGNKAEEESIRREIGKANRAFREIGVCSSIGGLLTYVGIPLIIADALFGPVFGTSATVAGFGIQAYADWKKRRHRWLLVRS